jgi:hypothetical protein
MAARRPKVPEPEPSSAEVLQNLKEATRAHCADRYEQLRGHPWGAGGEPERAEWIERCNRQERDAYKAFGALQKGLLAVRDYYRKHPGDRPLTIFAGRALIRDGAFADKDYDPADDEPQFSNHGSWLHDLREHIEPMLLQRPWLLDERSEFTWEKRNMVVQLYDTEYAAGALRVRAPGADPLSVRLNGTELAWHSILHGMWPGLPNLGSEQYTAEEVVQVEAKSVGEAKKRLEGQRRREEARTKRLMEKP